MPRVQDPSAPARLGMVVRDLRMALGWTQGRLGRRAGLSQSWVSRIERGDTRETSVLVLERLVAAMGGRLLIEVDAPFLADRTRQRDVAHARAASYTAGRLRAARWQVAAEVEVGGDRSRGWIDLLAYRADTGVVLVIEVKTELQDLGAIQRSMGWYEREAWAAARRAGWRPQTVRGVLLLLATGVNDERSGANRAAIASGFPVRARTLGSVVTSGRAPAEPGRAIAMVDPRSRRREWLRPLRLDGRSRPAPYLDYAGFMRSARGRR